MMIRAIVFGALMVGLAACGGKNTMDDRHNGDTTDMTPAPTPSGYSDKTGTTGNTDSIGVGRNNPAQSAREGAMGDTGGGNHLGGIRNMGSDTPARGTIDTPRSGTPR